MADEWERGILLPIEKNKATGELRLAAPQLALDALNAGTLPGRALKGEFPELDPRNAPGNTYTDRVIGEGLNFSSWVTGGSGALPAPSGSIRMGLHAVTEGSPFFVKPKPRPKPFDNYLAPLSDHAPLVYRETMPEHALELVPHGNIQTNLTNREFFLADTPELALGQGNNKGVLLAFDASKLQGKISKTKPGAENLYERGLAEYVARLNNQKDYRDAVVGIRIADDATFDRVSKAKWERATEKLEKDGWQKVSGDGFTEWRKPAALAAGAVATGVSGGASAAEKNKGGDAPKMKVYTIQAPDGRKIKVEAANEDAAIKGARQFVQNNPVQPDTGAGPDTLPLPVPGTFEPPEQTGGYDESYFAQGTSGVNEGIATALGAPVDITNLALRAGAAGVNALTGSNIDLPVNALGGRQTFVDMMGPAIKAETDDPGKQFVRRVGQEVGASAVPAAGVVAKSAKPLQSAATQLAVATGSGVGGAVAERVAPDNPYVELAGQILGGAAVAGGIAGLRKLATPYDIPADRRAMNAKMADEGVELTAGQQTGNRGLKYTESELGGARIEDLTERQREQFTEAALARIGVRASKATPEVMRAATKQIGQQFDDLAARNVLLPDKQLSDDLSNVVREYNSLVNESARAPIVQNTLQDIVDAVKRNAGGQIDGEAFQSLSSRLFKAAKSTKDPELKFALFGIRDALDDAMERTIQQINPDDLGAWQMARSDYKNLLAIEDAVGRAGEAAAFGIISPAQLRSAVARQGKRAYVTGQNDLGELARAGVATMTPMPQSGTAPRQAVRALGMSIPAALGAGGGAYVGGSSGAIAGMAAGAALPRALGAFITSDVGKRYLTNQAFTKSISLGEAIAGPALAAPLQTLQNQNQNALRVQALN